MAGPSARYYNIALHLSARFMVTVLAPPDSEFGGHPFLIKPLERRTLKSELEKCDVVMVQGVTMAHYPSIQSCGKPIVVDLYDPFIIENLELRREERLRDQLFEYDRQVTVQQLKYGDFFVCSSQRQIDFWIGALTAVGRINPANYNNSPTGAAIISQLQFGLPSELPRHSRSVLRNVHPNISDQTFIIVWGGGMWDWLDPITPIKALKKVLAVEPNVVLYFMGSSGPNSSTLTKKASESIALAKQLGLYEKSVFFNDWVKYDDRANYLLEADAGISFHQAHLEARYAYRTRMLDYIWTTTPIIAAEGDETSNLVRSRDLGVVVAPGDADALASAMLNFIRDKDALHRRRKNLEVIRSEFTWETQLKDLVKFCENPYIQPDKEQPFRRRLSIIEGSLLFGLTGYPRTRKLLKRIRSLLKRKGNTH